MMNKTPILAFITSLSIVFTIVSPTRAQEPAAATATNEQSEEQKQKEKDAAEKKAVALLEQIVSEVQMMKLPENRIRVQIAAGDLLWKRNEARARSLFSFASEGVAEMMRNSDGNMQRWAAQLRQELVLSVAQHDAPLAYQLLAATRSPNPVAETANVFRRPNFDANLDQALLARVAAKDPGLAAQKVEESLAKGDYPGSVAQVLSQLQAQDKEAASKLSAKVVSKLQSENMLANLQAQSLAMNLVRLGPAQSGPTPTANQVNASQSNRGNAGQAVLSEAAYQELLNTLIDAALRATPQTANNQRGQNARGRGNFGVPQTADQNSLSDGQIEQQNARRLLNGLQTLLPQIDLYLPSRATTLRNKMTEVGVGNNQRLAANQLNSLMQQGTADSLLAAAPSAPPPLQARLYQQAVQKALAEGNADRARQIANEHLDPSIRDVVLKRVDFQLVAKKLETENMDQQRLTLAGLRSDNERIDLLLMLAAAAQKTVADSKAATASEHGAKPALVFLEEARRLANRRVTSYGQFDQQLRVAEALAVLDPAHSFEVLDSGINQLNELLSAAATLSGFEVNIFKDGELPLEGGSQLGDMVARYGRGVANLAKMDFARAESSANKFQLAEPRLFTQLSIVRRILGGPQVPPADNGFIGGFGPRRGQ